MRFHTVAGLLAVELALFFAVIVSANLAVFQMAKRLDDRYHDGKSLGSWNIIGRHSDCILNEYRQAAWPDTLPERQLSSGYKLTFSSLFIMCATSVIGRALRG